MYIHFDGKKNSSLSAVLQIRIITGEKSPPPCLISFLTNCASPPGCKGTFEYLIVWDSWGKPYEMEIFYSKWQEELRHKDQETELNLLI